MRVFEVFEVFTHSSVNMTSYRDGEIESNDGDCGLGDLSHG